MLSAIIVAAGSSRRMGFDKLFAPLGGSSVIAQAIGAFERANSIGEIIVVVRSDRLGEFERTLKGRDKISGIVPGGEHRQNSVAAGLARLNASAKYVAVHDGARPLITPEEIDRVYAAAQDRGAAVLAEPVADTLKR